MKKNIKMKQEKINEICNGITAEGKAPFALVYTAGEMKTRPKDGWDVFNADTLPEIQEIYDSEEKARERLKECGSMYCIESRGSSGVKFFDCHAFLICGLVDEFEDRESWNIDFDKLIDASPAPEEEQEEE